MTDAKPLEDLVARAKAWIMGDPDHATCAEMRALIDQGQNAELADRFAGRLEFGTAGLRGVIGAGPNRMNRAVVIQTTYGLAEWLRSVPDAARRGVVVGCDGRRMSREFAEDVALVLAAAKIKVWLFSNLVPTPLVGFACASLGTAAGVMITASHNPPEYNGYKVYGPNAVQITPPIDGLIAAAISKAPFANEVPRAERAAATAAGLVKDVPATVEHDYLERVRTLVGPATPARAFPIVYTPMHGVGGAICMKAFADNGFTQVKPVPEQFEPDGRFPTVAFPNPEEKGAMDLSLALARREKAELVIANDPDADRLAIAVPGKMPGEYVQLTGNQVGVLLGHHLLTRAGAKKDAKRLVITTIVSSPMLGVIARKLGVAYEETLTGFKWIASRALELAQTEQREFVFGYEEALGYTVSTLVRDKDGVSAAVVFADLVASLRARNTTVLAELEELARRYGLFVSEQVSVTRKGADGVAAIKRMMSRLRSDAPKRIGPLDVVALRDYQARVRTDLATGATQPLTLPVSDVITLDFAGGSRIIARPSGTEPKIKFYIDVCEPIAAGELVEAARARATVTLAALKDDFRTRYGN